MLRRTDDGRVVCSFCGYSWTPWEEGKLPVFCTSCGRRYNQTRAHLTAEEWIEMAARRPHTNLLRRLAEVAPGAAKRAQLRGDSNEEIARQILAHTEGVPR